MNETIAAVVVTYNRKELLLNCLEALRSQTHKPDAIYIIDNSSTDGTPELLFDKKYLPWLPKINSNENQTINHSINSFDGRKGRILINYVRKLENDGGAGGFHEGMKQAYEAGFSWIWMMDDDGIPSNSQLEKLLYYSNKYKVHLSNALVVNIENKNKLAFGLGKNLLTADVCESEIIKNKINPFNGTLISRVVPGDIGFIKKEMFIWGDEAEYTKRVVKFGYNIGTIVAAIHYHPENRGRSENVIPFVKKFMVTIKPKNLSHIYYRNLGYINFKYNKKIFLYYFFSYSIYFVFRLKLGEMLKFLIHYRKGACNEFR